MTTGKIKVLKSIKEWAVEAGGYVWDDNIEGEERPVKVNDHCLTGDTLVKTKNGKRKISDLVGKSGYVWSYSRLFHRKVLRRFTDVRLTQKSAKIYKITFSDGQTLRCTGNHKILTKNRGWVQAKYLKQSDRVIVTMD
jgi:intein/homing endonuclease